MKNALYSYTREKLFKINGEYVKFYVTTNDKLHKLLANSGAAVIYHENSTNINYLYVGGELIASGWGLKSQKSRDDIEWWANSYVGVLDDIDDKLQEFKDRLDNINQEIIDESVERFVAINKGEIKKTVLTYKDTQYKTENVVDLIFDQYEYKPYELLDIYISVKYNNNGGDQEEIIFKPSDPKMLPVGAVIRNIEMIIPIELNDSGPVKNIELIYKHNNVSAYDKEEDTFTIITQAMDDNMTWPTIVKESIDDIKMTGNYNELFSEVESDNELKNNLKCLYRYEFNIEGDKNNEQATDSYIRFNISLLDDGTDVTKKYLKVQPGDNNLIKELTIKLGATPVSKQKVYDFSIDPENKEYYENPIYNSHNIVPEQIIKLTDLLNIKGVEPVYIVENNLRIWRKANFTEGTYGYTQDLSKKHPGLIVPYDSTIENNFLKPQPITKNIYNGNKIKTITTYQSEGFKLDNVKQFLTLSSTIQYVFSDYSFNMRAYKDAYTLMFMIPNDYTVKKIYYINSQNDKVDLTGYFTYCGNEKITKDIEFNSNKKTVKTIIRSDVKLYYAFSLEGFKKDFDLTVELEPMKTTTYNSTLHLDVSEGSQLLHQIDFDTDHWYDADLSTIIVTENSDNIKNVNENDSEIVLYDNAESFNALKDYLEKTSQYL